VVTKAGLWLMPRPETIVTGTIRCEGDGDIVPMIDMLRRLMHEGVLQGVPMIVGTPADTENEEAGNGATMRNLRRVLRPAAGTRASASMAPPAWSKRGAPFWKKPAPPCPARCWNCALIPARPARTRWNRGT
jgi:hypothetical protein